MIPIRTPCNGTPVLPRRFKLHVWRPIERPEEGEEGYYEQVEQTLETSEKGPILVEEKWVGKFRPATPEDEGRKDSVVVYTPDDEFKPFRIVPVESAVKMRTKKKKKEKHEPPLKFEILRCNGPCKGKLALAVARHGDSSTRLTSHKCAGSWSVVETLKVDERGVEDLLATLECPRCDGYFGTCPHCDKCPRLLPMPDPGGRVTTVHIYDTFEQPATRWRIAVMPKRKYIKCPAYRLLKCVSCKKKHRAENMVVKALLRRDLRVL